MKPGISKLFKISVTMIAALIFIFLLPGCLADEATPYFTPDAGSSGDEDTTIIVTGTGSHKVIPDRVLVDISVFNEESTSEQAVNANSTTTEKVITGLEGLDIADLKIQTASFNLDPLYDYRRENEPPEIYAYRATTVLEVSTGEILSIGEILSTAIEAGSNDISSLKFDLSENLQKEAKSLALDKAANDAKNKAYSIAESLGLEIEGVYNINELETYYPGPVFSRGDFAVEEAGAEKIAPLPVSPGEVEVTASLQITYTFK